MRALKKNEELAARGKIVLWRKPLTTFTYFIQDVAFHCNVALQKFEKCYIAVISVITTVLCLYLVLKYDGPHQAYLLPIWKKVIWCLYWLGLGVLSSIGFGSGLHTFVLYLGPHIASVTLAAYECKTLAFPEPPYPDDIICPDNSESGGVSFYQIMDKVRLEAMMWGAGTALGELPPYFMAKAARLSGYDPEDEDDLKEFDTFLKKGSVKDLNFVDKIKFQIERLVEKVGFFAILLCASIPNPLFDLAGITCGHFLVPFWTFFGATLFGKAVIKMHIQQILVIAAFDEKLIGKILNLMTRVPFFGRRLQQPFKDVLLRQKMKFHGQSGGQIADGGNSLNWILEKVVIVMIMYFVVSIVNCSAQSHHKRLCKSKRTKNSKDLQNLLRNADKKEEKSCKHRKKSK